MSEQDMIHLLGVVTAQRDEAVSYMRRLLAMQRGNEFAWPDAQATTRGARKLLAEIEGK